MSYKCPVCGSNDCRVFGVYNDSVRCNLCGTTDSPKMFEATTEYKKSEPESPSSPEAFGHVTYEKDRYPNLHAAGLTGMIIDGSRITMHGRDLTLEDFKRIGRAVFGVVVIPTKTSPWDIDGLAHAAQQTYKNNGVTVSGKWRAAVIEILQRVQQ